MQLVKKGDALLENSINSF